MLWPAFQSETTVALTKYMDGQHTLDVELPCPRCGRLTIWTYTVPREGDYIAPTIECNCGTRRLFNNREGR